jgi:flagellar assembly protein FliH
VETPGSSLVTSSEESSRRHTYAEYDAGMSAPGSRVIKRAAPAPDAGSGNPEELLAAACARAREIVVTAEAEAAEIRGGAAEELRRARFEASEAGHAEGTARAAAALALATSVREARLAELEGELIEIALGVARRIVGQELSSSPEAVVEMARRALRAAAGGGEIRLRVAAGDLATVTAADGQLRSLVERGSLAIVEDPGLASGEVVVEVAGGLVDARIDAQLEPFRRALAEER